MAVARSFLSIFVTFCLIVFSDSFPSAWASSQKPSGPSVETHQTKRISKNASQHQLLNEITFSQLGYPSGIQLSGDSASDSVFIPIDPNVNPKSLNLNLKPSPKMPVSKIWATVNGDVIASEVVPSTASVWKIPLSRSLVQHGTIPVKFHTAIANPNVCLGRITDWIEIGPQSTIQWELQMPVKAPAISTFFPAYLRAVHIHIVPPLTASKAQATLDLATYLDHRYKGLPPTVSVSTSEVLNGSFSPYTREVIVGSQTSGTNITTIDTPRKQTTYALALGEKNLVSQAHALFQTQVGMDGVPVEGTSDLSTVNTSSEVSGHRMTLAQLGYTSQEAQGSGDVSMIYNFSQADLGGAVNHLAIRLGGVHSPLVSGATGYVNLVLNGTPFFSSSLSGTNLDIYAPVPNNLLQRDNSLAVQFFYTPPGGACSAGSLPLTATIYNSSYVQFHKGQTLPSGFDQFPQVFAKGFNVMFSSLNLDRLNEAVQLIGGMQTATRTLLHPNVVKNSTTGTPLLYIGTLSRKDSLLKLQPFELLNSSGQAVMTYHPNSPFSALEAQTNTLALIGPDSTSRQLVSDILKGQGWYTLNGDIVLLGESGSMSHLSIESTGLRVQPLQPTVKSFWIRYRRWIFMAFFLLLIASLVAVYPRIVRKDKRRLDKRHRNAPNLSSEQSPGAPWNRSLERADVNQDTTESYETTANEGHEMDRHPSRMSSNHNTMRPPGASRRDRKKRRRNR